MLNTCDSQGTVSLQCLQLQQRQAHLPIACRFAAGARTGAIMASPGAVAANTVALRAGVSERNQPRPRDGESVVFEPHRFHHGDVVLVPVPVVVGNVAGRTLRVHPPGGVDWAGRGVADRAGHAGGVGPRKSVPDRGTSLQCSPPKNRRFGMCECAAAARAGGAWQVRHCSGHTAQPAFPALRRRVAFACDSMNAARADAKCGEDANVVRVRRA